AVERAGLEVGDIVRPVAERGIGLRGDAISAAEKIEIIDEGRAKIDLERLEDPRWRDAEDLRLVAVYLGTDAGGSGIEEGVDPGEPLLLVGLSNDGVGSLLQRAVTFAVLILHHHAETTSRADAANDG